MGDVIPAMLYKKALLLALLALPLTLLAQTRDRSPLDPTVWGVVYDTPATKQVKVTSEVTYLKDDRSDLKIDIYSPPEMKAGERRPAIIFLNAIGDQPTNKVKSWAIYSSWPRLVAAHGMIGISMDADGTRIQDSLKGLFDFLAKDGAKHGIDPDRLGVYAASANTTQANIYLMGENAAKGIKAAALYYGGAPQGALRKDLPVLFILAEGDLGGGFGQQAVALWQRVAEARAPWTMVFASRQPHAFDAFEDSDESRRIVKQTIDFWKTNLEPVPKPSWEPSKDRAVVSAIYMNDPAKSAAMLKTYTEANPRDAQGFVHYARMLSQQQKFPEAFAAFDTAHKLDPSNPAALSGMGQVRFSEKRYAEAESYITTAINAGFRNPGNYNQLAFSQLFQNKNEEAVKSFEAALSMGMTGQFRATALYNLACAYARLKNADKAFEMLNQAVDAGRINRATYESDTDLAPLRSDPRFEKLLERLSR